jgi:hypothetical protein
MRTSTKITALIGSGVLVVATAGAAFAYWTTTGSGTGTATAGTNAGAVALVIAQPTPNTGFVPGGAAQDVNVTVANNATYSQSVGSIAASATYPDLCLAANWTLTPVANTGATLAAGATSSAIKVATIALKDLGVSTNQDGCKGAQVTFAFTG